MKKRLISAFVALSMIFSLIPTTFAQQSYDSDGNLTGSPNIVKDLKFEITAGELTQFDITFGNGINNPGTYFAGIVTDYNDDAVGNDYTDVVTDDSVGVGYFTITETIPYDPDTGECWGLYGPAAQWTGGSSPDSTVNLTWGSATNKSFNWTEGEEGFGSNFAIDMGHEAYTSIADLEGCSVYVYILVGNVDNADFSNAFVANVGAFDAEGNLKFPEGGDPTPEPPADNDGEPITSVTVMMDEPVVGGDPDNFSGSLGPSTGATLTSVTWNTTSPALTPGGKFDASSVYTATVVLSAENGYIFDTSSVVTFEGFSAITPVTLTQDMISNDGKTATVTYTAPATEALKVTGVTASGSLTTDSYTPGENFDASGLTATITYNNGESVSNIDPTSNAYGVFAALATDAQSASSDSNGDALELNDNGKNVYLVYDHSADSTSKNANNTAGVDTTAGLVKSAIADTITVANEALTTAEVTLTYPVVGAAPSTSITPGDATKYSATVDLWSTDEDGNNAVSGNFAYDQDYYVQITLTPESGYAFDTAQDITVTVHDTASGTDKTVTVPVDSDGNVYATVKFDASPSTDVTFVSASAYDAYNGGNDVTITLNLGTHATSDITGLTIDGENIEGYTVNADGTITVPKASLAGKFTGLTATAVSKDISIDVNQVNTPVTGTIMMSDTTPYITITQPQNGGSITSSPSIGTGRVALTKGQQYVLKFAGAPAHTTGYTWTVTGTTDTDSTDSTFTFTPAGGEDITATAEAIVAGSHTLTVNTDGTGSGSVAVKLVGGSALTANGDGSYTIYADESYELTATAANQSKFVEWNDGTTTATYAPTVLANPSGDVTVTATFDTKVDPTVNPSATQVFRKNDTTGDIVYTYTLGDYASVSISGVTGTHDSVNKTYTITNATLNGLSDGTHTVTFDFGEGKTITRDIEVKAARSISNITLPTTAFKHGDSFDMTGFAFTITTDGNAVTYTYDGTSWDKTLPSDVQIKLGNGSYMAPDTFISTYEAKITRHDTDETDTVNNGDLITVSAGSVVAPSDTGITVGTKEITLTATATDFDKVYDGNAIVSESDLNVADFTSQLVSGDDVTYTSMTGTYKASGLFAAKDADEDNARDIEFSNVVMSGNDKDNYTYKVNDASGKITKRPLVITAINNIPDAVQNKEDTKTGNWNANIVSGGSDVTLTLNTTNYDVVDGDTVYIKYHYEYNDISSVRTVNDVEVSNIAIIEYDSESTEYNDVKYKTGSNYSILPTSLSNQAGEVVERKINSISISDPNKTEYYYSDTFDPTGIKVTVEYDGEVDPVPYNWDEVPNTITVKWTGGSAVTGTETLNVPDYNTKTITATDGTHSDSTSAITVNKLPVIVTASGTINKVYDGTTTYTGNDVIYTNALDTDKLADNGTYSAKVAELGTTTATVAFGGVNATTTPIAADVTDPVLTDMDNFEPTIKNEVTYTISKRPIKVSAITVDSVYQGSAGSDSVSSAQAPEVTFTDVDGNVANAVVGSEKPTVKYTYQYNDTSVVGTTNDITITGLDLTSDSVNSNYDYITSDPIPTGEVLPREAKGITVTAPTQFIDSQVTPVVYGTPLDLTGLTVQVEYNTGEETYVWNNDGTWTLKIQNESDTTVTTVPFTWKWQTLDSDPVQGSPLTVVDHNDKGIVVTSTVTPDESGTSAVVKVDPKEVSAITITGDNVTKKYDGNTDVIGANFTYTLTDTLVGTDALTIAPTKLEYDDANVGTGKTLVYTGWTLTADNGTTDVANYKIAATPVIAAGAPTGDIEKRPITLTHINNVPDINQYDENKERSSSATSADNATFAANASAQTGIVGEEIVTVYYKYVYVDPDTATEENAAEVTLNDVRLDNTEGSLTPYENDKYILTWTGATATGRVLETAISGVDITTLPAQFQSGADVQYGDTLDLSGLVVTVSYGDTVSKTETYTYDGSIWTKDGDTESVTPPFTLTMDGSAPVNGSPLAVSTTPKSLTVTTGNGKTDTDGSLVVNPRKVTVVPSGTNVTKVYDGNTTYTNDGAITWTVTAVGTFTGTLPTVTSATYTYNSKNVAEATHVTASSPILSDTTNFVVDNYADTDIDATITERKIQLTEITNIPEVYQYATTNLSGTGITATSPSQAVFAAADITNGIYDIVSGDTVTIKYDYSYTDTTGIVVNNVSLTNIVLDSSIPSTNYVLDTDIPETAVMPPTSRTVDTIDVENPTQLQSAVTYKDSLDLAGLEVTINYTSGDPDVYTYDGSVWTKDGVTVTPPFTYNWSDTSNGASLAQGETLTVDKHNGNKIKVEYDGVTGEGAAVTVNPKEITAINATLTSGEIAKVYDATTDLEAADEALIEYTLTGVASGDVVEISTTPSYASKDKGDSIAIEFTAPTLTNSVNGNYKLADGLTVSSGLTGKITAKEVTIDAVYVPLTYVDDTAAADLEIAVSNATLAASVTTNTVTAKGFVGNEGNAMKFDYTIVYPQSSLAAAGTPAVSIKDGEGTVTGTGVGNYTFVWPANLTGNVLADQFTGVEITQPTKMTGYTHGDVFEPVGMTVTIKTSSDPTGTTYTVTGTNGSYAWDNALPAGVSVAVGGVSLTSNADLNRNAHHLNMNDNKITVTAGAESDSSDDKVEVAKKQLTATASATGTLEKTYDATTNLPTGTNVTYPIGTGEVATFGGVTDTVTVTATSVYESADAADPRMVKTPSPSIGLDGIDKDNYIAPTSIADLTGKITPYEIVITEIAAGSIPDATYNVEKAGDVPTDSSDSFTNYTAAMNNLSKPAIKFHYDYGTLVNTVANNVDVPVSNIVFKNTETNYTLKTDDANFVKTTKGNVVLAGIDTITVNVSNPYTYGDKLENMTVDVTFIEGDPIEGIKYGDANWNLLGLELEAKDKNGATITIDPNTTVLTNTAHNGATITVKQGSTADDATLTVNKRTLNITGTPSATVTKAYDGTATVEQTITLAIEAGNASFDGLLAGDSCTLSNTTPTYVYDDKNVAENISLTCGETVTLTGDNASEYTLTFPELTGTITKKNVTITAITNIPSIMQYTEDLTNSNDEPSVSTNGSGDITIEEDLALNESITVKYTYEYPDSITSGTRTDVAIKSCVLVNADNYNLVSYPPTGTGEVEVNEITGIHIDNPTSLTYTYGDTLDLTGLEVTVEYAVGSPKSNVVYGSTDWTNLGLTIDGVADGTILKPSVHNNAEVKVKTDKVTSDNAVKLTVNKINLTLTAAASGTITKVYDSTTNVDADNKAKITPTVTGGLNSDNIAVSVDTVAYADKNVGTGKTINVELSLSGDNLSEYDYTLTGYTVTGDITVKDITIVVIKVPEILSGSTGADLKPEITSYTYKDNVAPYGSDDVTIKISAVYTETDAAVPGTPTVTFEKNITGDDVNNYNFILDPTSGPGSVVDNIITNIAVTGGEDTYVHGDNLDLTGMVITVTYKDPIDDNVYTYNVPGNNWTDKNGTSVNTEDLPVSIALNSTTVTDAKQQLRHDTHDTNKLVVSGGQANSVEALTLAVAQKEITEITVGYADTYTAADITKTYNGLVNVDDEEKFSYTANNIVSFGGVADTVNVTAAAGAATYDTKDVNAVADSKVIEFNDKTKFSIDNANYKLADNFTINGTVNGNITKADLTINITSVPSIFVGANTEVTLTKDTHFTQTGEQNGETVNVTVKGTYADSTTDGTKAVTFTTDPTTLDNYNIVVNDNGTTGTVNKKPVTGITVTGPTSTEYEHGDNLDLEGLTITVTYADETKEYTYSNDQWTIGGTPIAAPEDVTITWGGTTTPVTDDAKLRLDDTDKNLVADGDNKKGSITVTATVYDPASNAPSDAVDVTITKKQLTLGVSGDLTKTYDGTTNITADTAGTPLTFTLGGVDNADVSLNETATQDNVKFATKDYTDTPQALTVDTVVLTGNEQFYELKTTSITNTATGQVTKKAIKVTAINPGPSVETDASATGTMEVSKAGYTTDPVDGIIGSEDITIVVEYTFTNGTAEPDQNAPVTYNNATASVATGSEEVAKNYDITFEIADGTGKVTGGEVTGITIKSPDKTAGYVHGDTIDLTGTEITITYDGKADKTDKYVYDPATGKWTYTKNGVEQPGKVDLPSEITIGFTGGNTITPTSQVKYPDNGKTITATYSKDTVNMCATTDTPFEIGKRPITVVVQPPTTSEPMLEQEYTSEKALSTENLDKIKANPFTESAWIKSDIADVKVTGEDVTISLGTLVAEFISEDVVYDVDNNVTAQPITVKAESFTLDGDDKDCYEIVISDNATGKITPKAVTVTANSVPSIKEEETNLVVDITDITTEGIISGDDVVITWKGTYDKTTETVDTTTTREVSGSDAGNYTVTFTPDSAQGSVTLKVVTGITIDHQPKYADETPKHGDTVGADGLDNLEYTVEYSDGSTTKHKKENGEWVTTDGYTEPEAGTKFTWNDTIEEVTENSVIRKDKDNTVTIAVEGKTATTDVVAAAAKPVTITAVGTYTKVYDGTNTITLNETTPEITYVIEGLVEGDVITVTATPAFADENVAKFGDIYQKAINFTNVVVTGDESVLANYEIQKDENGNEISPIMGSITPKTMNITGITVSSKKKGADVEVSASKSKKFTTTDIIAKDEGTVTISYKGTYSSTSTVGKDIPVTVDPASVIIDGDEKAILNYVVGTVTGAVGEVTSGGSSGGGGGGNSLTIKYELEDGKAGKSVSKITAPAGSDPVDLIAVYASKLSDPTVIWTSSDENIVKVDENGIVSFIAEGEATVTATSKKQKTLTDKVTVTVTKSLATPEPTRGPELITKTMLNPYIVGYGDNVFGPELPISREEVATIFARLIANDLYMDKEYTPSFFDVDPAGWSKDYIGYLEGYSVISGYEDGSFKPKNYITRAEMAVLMAKAEGYDVYGYLDGEETGFNDIRDGYCEWATKAIKHLTEAGVMYGYEDGSFRPGQPITRAETVATINRVLSNQKVAEAKVLPSDVSLDHWAYDDIVFAMNHRVLKDVSADASIFIESDEFDDNMVTITETVYDTTEENEDGDTTSPSETPAPTTAPEATPPVSEEEKE